MTTRESNEALVLAYCGVAPRSAMEVSRACGIEGAHAVLERLVAAGELRRGVRQGALCVVPTYDGTAQLCERCRREVA